MRAQLVLRLALITGVLCGSVLAWPAEAQPTPGGGLAIETLSNRADLISGGDAVVQVDLPDGATAAAVALNGTDITSEFALRPNGKFQALVTGLKDGANSIVARVGQQSAQLTVTNHSIEGPVFSGPQLQPWYCLAGALDGGCNRPITYTYQYMSKVTKKFAAYDPNNPPADLATTTTDQGKTVPYIVRLESGDEDRSAYSIAVLDDPSVPFTRWTGPPEWNHKVFVTHGGGCAGMHTEGAPPSTLDSNSLGRGFLVMSTALDDSNQDCDLVVQAESIMMAKEHIIEAYGDVRYTMGMGSSGGSLAALQMANAYPGLYDGLIVGATFPDMMDTDLLDCLQIHRYFDNPQKWGTGIAWAEPLEAAVEDKQSTSVCHLEAAPGGPEDYSNAYNPSDPAWCNMGSSGGNHPELVYNASTNPSGVRCALQDYFVNILGKRDPQYWGANEKKIGYGFANRPYDNVGVQYGFNALMAGKITPEQFVDLNVKIGATDIDFGSQTTRVAAEPAGLEAAYRSGMVDEGNNLDLIPIIDIPNPGDNYDIHDKWKSWAIRARLDAANGNHDNEVIWYGPDQQGMAANSGDGNAFLLMDQWLTKLETDQRDISKEQKVATDKPAGAHDRCDLPNQDICNQVMGPYGSIRNGAGAGIANDIMKCQLMPLVRSDYTPIQFTDAEWAQLQQTFPTGVCDWTQPGVGQQLTNGWQTYAAGPGGQPLGDPPVSTPGDTPPPSVPEVPFAIVLPLAAITVVLAAWRRRAAR